MLLTALSYGRMARVYPSAGSAFTYVGRELHPSLGYITGWSMVMDYVVNPLICIIWCSGQASSMTGLPRPVWAVVFFALFTGLNLRGGLVYAWQNGAATSQGDPSKTTRLKLDFLETVLARLAADATANDV